MADKIVLPLIFGVLYPILIISVYLLVKFFDLGVFGHFLIYVVLVGIIISASVLLNFFGPRKYIYRLEDWEKPENQYHPQGFDTNKYPVLLDTHFHTKYSDGWLTVEQAIMWHIAMGFNAFVITDHETCEGDKEIPALQAKYKDRIIILPGIELANEIGHFNVIGVDSWDKGKFAGLKGADYVKAIIKEAHSRGAVVTVNHFPWSTWGKLPRYDPKKHITREQALEWGIDLIETANWDDDLSPLDDESLQFARQHPEIGPIVGTDVHTPEKDNLYGWTLIATKGRTAEAIMDALRNKRTDVLRYSGGIPYPTKHQETLGYRLLKPFYKLGQIFVGLHKRGNGLNLDFGGILTWVVYLLFLFGIIELIHSVYQ